MASSSVNGRRVECLKVSRHAATSLARAKATGAAPDIISRYLLRLRSVSEKQEVSWNLTLTNQPVTFVKNRIRRNPAVKNTIVTIGRFIR